MLEDYLDQLKSVKVKIGYLSSHLLGRERRKKDWRIRRGGFCSRILE